MPAALAWLYRSVRLFVNFFQPSFKLAAKTREGAKVKKRYHSPATPHQRLLADPRTAEDVRRRVEAVHAGLDPVRLSRQNHPAPRARTPAAPRLLSNGADALTQPHTPQPARPAIRNCSPPAAKVEIKRDRVSADAAVNRRSRGPAGLMNFPG
jgi:hypothetical protein